MLTRIYLFIIGYASVFIPSDKIEELTRRIFELGISVIFGKRGKKGRRIIFRRCDFLELGEGLSEAGLISEKVKFGGIPHIAELYGKRIGLMIGALIFISAMIFCNGFVWRIEVSGNENIPEERIIAELSELGFYEGVRYHGIDFDVLHNRFLARSEDIAWIAVNMRGSVAYVEVREYQKGGTKPTGYANIVAGCDGVITQVSVFSGKSQVSIGDEVKRGQILISGVIEYEGQPPEFVYAEGEVYAEVSRRILTKIPLTAEYREPYGEKIENYGIKFFSGERFFSEKGRIDGVFYDTITMYNKLSVFGSAPLPIAFIKTVHTPYRTVTKTLTEAEAAAMAYREYKRAFIDATEGVTLLSYDMTSGISEMGDIYEIDAALKVISDIAETKEFTVEN